MVPAMARASGRRGGKKRWARASGRRGGKKRWRGPPARWADLRSGCSPLVGFFPANRAASVGFRLRQKLRRLEVTAAGWRPAPQEWVSLRHFAGYVVGHSGRDRGLILLGESPQRESTQRSGFLRLCYRIFHAGSESTAKP